MNILCWNHECKKPYDVAQFSKDDRNILCDTCGSTVISELGQVQMTYMKELLTTVNLADLKQEIEEKPKLYHCTAITVGQTIEDFIVAQNETQAKKQFEKAIDDLSGDVLQIFVEDVQPKIKGYRLNLTKE